MSKTLIALGGAGGVWDELEQAQALCPDADVGACNDAGVHYAGHLSLWCSLHPEKFAKWQRLRHLKGLNEDYVAVAHKGHANTRIDHIQHEFWHGTSGLYVCQVALCLLGYDRVIACGMPIDDRPHQFDGAQWKAAAPYRRGWKEALGQREVRGRIKSMSGWTRQQTGLPTPDWLAVPA